MGDKEDPQLRTVEEKKIGRDRNEPEQQWWETDHILSFDARDRVVVHDVPRAVLVS